MNGLAKDPRARWLKRRTTVLPTIVATALVWVVASGGPLIVVASSSTNHIVVALCLASVAKAVVHRGGPVGRWCPSGLGMN